MAIEKVKQNETYEETKKNVESPEEPEIPQETSPAKAAKTLSMIGSAYKYAWHVFLGTAVTAEKKVVGFFDGMAEKGIKFESKTEQSVIRHKAHDKIVGIEHMIDDGINKSLHFMGVPSRNDMEKLTSMVNDMSESLNIISGHMQKPIAEEKRGKPS